MRVKVTGYVVSESKKGTIGTTIYFECDHDDYRRENALKCVGNSCASEYIRGDYSDVLTVGETVELIYGKGYEGRAVLREIIAVEN